MSKGERYLVGLLLAILLDVAAVLMLRAGIYGLTIFIVAPAALGGLASWVFRPTTIGRAALLGAGTAAAGALSFLLLGREGLACILMSLPLVLPFGAFGGCVVYLAWSKLATGKIAMLLLLPPATLTWDIKAPPILFEVRTHVVIAAAPEQVWRQIVRVSELPEPPEWYFRAGIGYPLRAHIEGSGPGAIRYCDFSTGKLVEPVEVWDEPRVLQFRVTENPAPLREWGLWGSIEPKHLHGYLVSRRGQFKLTQLSEGHTLLQATTWYQHGLWPAEYWRWWSDAIIHRIHFRVLNNIRMLVEREREVSW